MFVTSVCSDVSHAAEFSLVTEEEEEEEVTGYGSPPAPVLETLVSTPDPVTPLVTPLVTPGLVTSDPPPNIAQVPSSELPDQTNPAQYLNSEAGAVTRVLNNPPFRDTVLQFGLPCSLTITQNSPSQKHLPSTFN